MHLLIFVVREDGAAPVTLFARWWQHTETLLLSEHSQTNTATYTHIHCCKDSSFILTHAHTQRKRKFAFP